MPTGSVKRIDVAMPSMLAKRLPLIGLLLENEQGRLLDLKTKVVIYSSAERDYTESLCWYSSRSTNAASDFDAEFDAAIRTIAGDTQRFPFCDDRHQFYLMRTFPFQIVFRCLTGEIHIVAVAHSSRKPNFWLAR